MKATEPRVVITHLPELDYYIRERGISERDVLGIYGLGRRRGSTASGARVRTARPAWSRTAIRECGRSGGAFGGRTAKRSGSVSRMSSTWTT